MKAERAHYQAYMLRLWLMDSSDQGVWRASLEDPHTGARRAFASLAALFAFLEEQTSGSLNGKEHPDDDYDFAL